MSFLTSMDLGVNTGLGLLRETIDIATCQRLRQPVRPHPLNHITPSFIKGNDRRIVEVFFSSGNVEPSVHGQNTDIKRFEFELLPRYPRKHVADVRYTHQEPIGQFELAPQ